MAASASTWWARGLTGPYPLMGVEAVTSIRLVGYVLEKIYRNFTKILLDKDRWFMVLFPFSRLRLRPGANLYGPYRA